MCETLFNVLNLQCLKYDGMLKDMDIEISSFKPNLYCEEIHMNHAADNMKGFILCVYMLSTF